MESVGSGKKLGPVFLLMGKNSDSDVTLNIEPTEWRQ
jgi:hypothetical protein